MPGTYALIVVRRFLVNFTEARSCPVVICITVVTDNDIDSRLSSHLDILNCLCLLKDELAALLSEVVPCDFRMHFHETSCSYSDYVFWDIVLFGPDDL